MNTNDLIESLTSDLRPVTPLPRPGRRAGLWMAGALVYVGALAVAMTGGDVHVGNLRAWLPQLAAIVASFVAVRTAFATVVPGNSASGPRAFSLAAFVWLGTLFAASTWQLPASAIAAARHEWLCVGLIVGGGAPLMVALVAMLRRGAPLSPLATAALGALAVGTVANVGACWSLPHGSNEITLVWHGGAVLALVIVAILLGRRVLSWPTGREVPPAR